MSPQDTALLEIKDVYEQARKSVDAMRTTRHHLTRAEIDLVSSRDRRERAVVSAALGAAARSLAEARTFISEAETILNRVAAYKEK